MIFLSTKLRNRSIMFEEGIYEQLISKVVSERLSQLPQAEFFIGTTVIDRVEASKLLSLYLSEVIRRALGSFTGEDALDKQIDLVNRVIYLLKDSLTDSSYEGDLIEAEAKILNALFRRINAEIADFDKHIESITPYTRLTHSDLFTGSNVGISLESEIKKEILSSNKICFLVSFIKWTGIRIFEKELRGFTESGGMLKIITTSYMGATDSKAVEFLSTLPNTEIKVSYNTENERLHAKAYLFHRNTGFHTAYIGSSNISRSALTTGLEWNLKVTTREVAHIIDKFQKTFESYWMDKEFEPFDGTRDLEKLRTALNRESRPNPNDFTTYFDIKPFPFQHEILEKLEVEREVHSRYRNLVVAATGTGKTVISAFDFKKFRGKNENARLLFVAHRKEILQQAQATFQGILRDNNFGQLWVDGLVPNHYRHLFASVQTLNNRLADLPLEPQFFDYVVIDEVHHIAASSYRPILERFSPKVLLGLTATPERMDNADILSDFCHTIAAEIRLPEALNRKLLCPFQYFGISDNVDLSHVSWINGAYSKGELTDLYTRNDERVGKILRDIEKYLSDPTSVRALGFCVTQQHAAYMSSKFQAAGLKADYLVADRSDLRLELRNALKNKEINFLFVVDIFNEGVDIPEIDTVLFLRPTESLTVFLQQLGRGLRLSDDKECLTVLDFVGNSRDEYDFEGKFRALIGKTNTSTVKEIQNSFPHLPNGCSIVLEEKAKEHILSNIKKATSLRRSHLLARISNFRHRTELPLTLRNFSDFYNYPLKAIYQKGSWKRLCADANQIADFSSVNESEVQRAISKKWLSCNSESYFQFLLSLARSDFEIEIDRLSEVEQQMCLMLHYDVWHNPGGFDSLEDSIRAIGRNPTMTAEMIEILELLEDRIDFLEYDAGLPYQQPLMVHARYTREQILAAFGLSSFETKSTNREGNAIARETNTELLFITLNKSDENYSPTTLYEDYAISESEFHWQTHNAAGPETVRGQNYINHAEIGRTILLFVRERNKDEYGNAMGSVFLGKARLINHYGSKPMSIRWSLDTPMPPHLWKESAKMAIG